MHSRNRIRVSFLKGNRAGTMLFKILIDRTINDAKTTGRGYKLNSGEIKIICYTHHATMITETEADTI